MGPSSSWSSWTMLRSIRDADEVNKHRLTRGTTRRIVQFARPYRRDIVVFLVTVVLAAGIGVATPVLAGHVVNAITGGGSEAATTGHPAGADDRRAGRGRRVPLAGPAVVFGAHRRGHHPRPAHQGVRPRPADAAAVLHPHPDRRPGQPAQQRRDRRPAGLHLDAVRCGQQRHPAGAHRRGDVQPVLADHRAVAGHAAGVHHPGPPGRQEAGRDHPRVVQPRREDERDHDRAVQRLRRAAGQAVRPARRGGRPVRRARRAGPRHRRAAGHVSRAPSSSRCCWSPRSRRR